MPKFFWADPPGQRAFPVAKAGFPLIAGGAFVTAVFALLELTAPALLALFATGCVCAFFRDPDRAIPATPGAVVSPADGKVIVAEQVTDCPFLDGPRLKLSVFMTVFNVHVNRIPVTGTVESVHYHPGKFVSANLDKASRENEHNAVIVQPDEGKPICYVQIAGLVARRIISWVQPGDHLVRGQRCGLICFGSRLDVYLPPDARAAVAVGEKVQAGTSILGYLPE
jgi:phosphatidylserine decarboxylase